MKGLGFRGPVGEGSQSPSRGRGQPQLQIPRKTFNLYLSLWLSRALSLQIVNA